MHLFTYVLAVPFLYLISVLPFPVLYRVSDFLYFMIFYVFGYRKELVYRNLSNSFPEKSEKEILKLRKKYYRYLCDLIIESFKSLTISKAAMIRHCAVRPETAQLFDSLYEKKKNVIVVMGHFGNWEWSGNAFSLTRKHQLYVLYSTLKNQYFNRFMIRMRSRMGLKLIPKRNAIREMILLRNAPIHATAFIADQAAPPEHSHWMQFLHQDTPVFLGTERIAKKLNYPVVYVTVQKLKRGYYEIGARLITEDPSAEKEFFITEEHTRLLEKDIRESEVTWNWSHKRWKHKRPAKVKEAI